MKHCVSVWSWVVTISFGVGLFIGAPPAQADPSTTDEVCGAFNLGVPGADIPGRLHANDGRENYWKGVHDSTWPIFEGQCG